MGFASQLHPHTCPALLQGTLAHMKILLIDQMGSFLDFSLRCEAQGHEVKFWLPQDKGGIEHTLGKGLITKVANWQSWMKWADIIITSDNVKVTPQLESWRKEGYPIFGCNAEVREWELERGVGQEVLESAGIPCVQSTIFSDYDKAMAHIVANPKRYVSKPTGDADKALSYVSKSPDDMWFMLEHWKRTTKTKVPFLLQEFIPGIEMAVGGWVGINGFSKYFLENFEFKKFMPGEIGVNTGEMGTAMKYCTIEESLLAQKLLLPIEAALIRSGYTGYIDVAVIIDKDGNPWPLEFTSRMGWPLMQIQQVLHPDVANWMLDLLCGKDTFEPSSEIALGVVVAMPDFPISKLPRVELSGFPIWGISDKNRYNVHPVELMLGDVTTIAGGSTKKVPMMVSAGNYLLVASGTGESVKEANCNAMGVIKELIIPNSPTYRNDIGHRIEKQLPELQALGYATSWDWE
jgi:phosphoribosylamine--glycine ligase